MKTINDRWVSQVCRCGLWLYLACAGGISALRAQPVPAVPEPPVESWETQSVRELMRRDLQDALRESSSSPVGGLPARSARPLLAPRLVALYGVGQALMAEVQVGQRAYLYVRGQAFPAGHAGDPGVYQLRGMNGACVQLERGQDRHSLCLRMLLGGEQP